MTQSSKDLIEEMRWQVQKIKDKQAENDQLLGKLDSVKGQLAALEAKATSPDGVVTVVAGTGGLVRSVQLTDEAMRSNAGTLTATLNATIERAIADATRMQLEIVRSKVGGTLTAEQILGPQAKFAALGEPSEGSSPNRFEVDLDDDEPFGGIFRSRCSWPAVRFQTAVVCICR